MRATSVASIEENSSYVRTAPRRSKAFTSLIVTFLLACYIRKHTSQTILLLTYTNNNLYDNQFSMFLRAFC